MSASASSNADTSSDNHSSSVDLLTAVSSMTTDVGEDRREDADPSPKSEGATQDPDLSSGLAQPGLDTSSENDDAVDGEEPLGTPGALPGPASSFDPIRDPFGMPPLGAAPPEDSITLRLQLGDDAREREYAEMLAKPVTSGSKRVQSGVRVLQYQQYVGHMEDRVRILENELEEIKKKQATIPDEAAGTKPAEEAAKEKDAERPDLICECFEANYEEFNNLDLLSKYVAIILPEWAEHFNQTSKNQDTPGATEGRISRLSIQSPLITAFLAKLLPKDSPLGLVTSILVRPFKPICLHEGEIRAHLKELEEEVTTREPLTRTGTGIESDTPASATAEGPPETVSDPYLEHDAQLYPGTAPGDEEKLSDRTLESIKKEIEHFQVLVKLMDNQLKPELDQHRLLRHGSPTNVAFENLWHLFSPGQIVYAESGNKQGYIVLNVRGGRRRFKPPVVATTSYKDPYATDPYGYKRDPLYRSPYDPVPPPEDPATKAASGKAYKIDNRNYTTFALDCVCIDFDGKEYGYVTFTSEIDYFKDEKVITDLPLVPARLGKSTNGKTRLELLKETGAKFEALVSAKIAHRDYVGTSLTETDSEGATRSREQIDSQVVIDLEHAYLEEQRRPKFSFPTFPDPEEGELPDKIGSRCPLPSCRYGDACPYGGILCYDDRKLDRALGQEFIDRKLHQDSSTSAWNEMRNSVLPGNVYGYVLRNLDWYKLDLDLLGEPRPTTNFNDLVLPDKNRRLVKALVSSRRVGSASKTERMDLVRGKGQGVIVLLHGVPGTGKSSTAECVAEELRCPLFTITCGNIGVMPSEVSENLQAMFYLAHKWNCVMLLDEADVFLQERDEKDLKRNAVVSVFLRALEYYSGVLFLTTNKVGKFDEAFVSRIHMSIHYPALDVDTTKAIWKVNLRKTRESKPHIEMDEDELLRYAKRIWSRQMEQSNIPWNGRQIRNAFQSAIALAEFDYAAEKETALQSGKSADSLKACLDYKHFRQVADISADFDEYLRKTLAGDAFDVASRQQARHDDRKDRSARQNAYTTPDPGRRSTSYKKQQYSQPQNTYSGRGSDHDDSDAGFRPRRPDMSTTNSRSNARNHRSDSPVPQRPADPDYDSFEESKSSRRRRLS